MKRDSKIHIDCSCGSHLFIASTDHEMHEIYVSYYSHGRKGEKFDFWWKLRTIWQVITKGTPYGDDITLNYSEAIKFSEFLRREVKYGSKR